VKHRVALVSVAAFALCAALVVAHPHFNKTVSVKLPSGAEATITYNTTPANEATAAKAAVGAFVTPRRPRLKVSAELTAGSTKVPAGEYVIGVIKNSDKDWTMALYPADAPRETDMSKVIKLDSLYSGSEGHADHMLIDITPGKGKFEGKAVLTLHFGTMFLAGALS
jgi:hypothetical protein